MGSYNLACSISDLSIGYKDEVVFFPLIQSNRIKNINNIHSKLRRTGSFTKTNELFSPFTLGIECKYNDYGSVTEVKKNFTTDFLEKMFNLKIEDIINIILKEENLFDLRSKVREELLSEDVSKVMNDYMERENLDNLTLVGFEKVNEDKYVHNRIEGLYVVKSERTPFIKIGYNGEEIENVAQFETVLRLVSFLTGEFLGLKDSEQNQKMTILENLSGMLIHKPIYNELIKPDEVHSYMTDIKESINEFRADLAKAETDEDEALSGLFHPLNSKYFVRYGFIENIKNVIFNYQELVDLVSKGEAIEQDIADFVSLNRNMYELNKVFRPALAGSQFGHPEGHRRLLEVMNSMMDKELQEYNKGS